ncbi:outer membrane beta-barrel protein [Taibaiella lutea]|nr:outer membrane beta-barrel protein [Taibaiella lutea]
MTVNVQVFDSINWKVPPDVKLFLLHNNDTLGSGIELNSGHFKLSSETAKSKLILLAEAPFYNNYTDSFSTNGDLSINLDTIYLTPTHILNEITIQSGYKSKIDRDTASFTADSFIIRRFDNAEQLLEKIPGIEITQNKGIRYYGQPINEISIDGIPFSNFDIHALLKLLRGRDVDKLKIYDAKPNLSNNFTEKSNPEKALNIILKEEAKHGYYGKLSAGAGKVDKFHWDNTSNVSSFNDNRSIVGYVTSNNTGNTSSYGESELTEQNTTDAPRGVPTDISAGVHYDRRLNKKLSFNANYRIGYNDQNASTEIVDINFLPTNQITTTTQSYFSSKAISNNATVQTSYQIDSFSSLNLVTNLSLGFFKGNAKNTSSAVNSDYTTVNSSLLYNEYHGNSPQASFSLSYIKNFRNGSNLIFSFSPYWNNTVTNASQSSTLNLMDSNTAQKSAQQKNNHEANSTYVFVSHYKSLLAKHLNLDINWQSNLSKSKSLLQTYDQYADSDNNIKDSLNPIYSSDYKFLSMSNSLSTKISMRRKKYSFQLGTDFNQTLWNQQNAYSAISQTRNFINALPFANINVTIGKTSFASVNYKLQAAQPTLNQIQPLVNNNNPLQIIVGNPDLVQSFSHNVGLNYTASSKNGNRSFNANSNLSIIKNAISFKQTIDEDGRQVSQYYNQNGNYFWNISSTYDISVGAKIRLSAGANGNWARTVTVVNNNDNIASTQSYGSRLSFTYALDTTLNLRFNSDINYSLNNTTLSSGSNNIVNYVTSLNATYSLPFFGLTTGTSVIWNAIQSSIDNDNKRNYIIWNAYIQRCINKSQSLSVKLYAHDLLNQNKGYLVYADNNTQHKETYNSIERYFLVGFIWNFTKR